MLRKNFKQFLAVSMAFSMLFTTNAFATPIDLANSTQDVKNDTLNQDAGTTYYDDELTNEWSDGTIPEEVRVKVDLASQFTITIPKDIVLDGSTGKADYKVKAVGDIAGDQKLSVVPDPDFVLSEAGGKADVTATVTQTDTEYIYTDLQGDGTEYDGVVQAQLTAGEWSGRFNFNVEFLASGNSLEKYSWDEIAAISEAGLAEEYFNIGDEKTITLNSYSYHDQFNGYLKFDSYEYVVTIIGFNHDDLADNTGKAGITFGFKDILKETKCLHYTQNSGGAIVITNSVGWKDFKLRKHLSDIVFNAFPEDLKDNIKEVKKIYSTGKSSYTIQTCNDKLFIPSLEEVGLNSTYNIKGQGTTYEYYETEENRIKLNINSESANWWTRSVSNHWSDGATCFLVNTLGLSAEAGTYSVAGISPHFCI